MTVYAGKYLTSGHPAARPEKIAQYSDHFIFDEREVSRDLANTF